MKRAKASSPGPCGGKVWVCRSSIICKRCSTPRRKRYAAMRVCAASSPIRPAWARAVSAPQFRDATAPDQLLRLSEKLDLTNAAASELDVVAAHRNRSVALMGVDLALDRMNVADSSEIQIAAPDIGPQMGEEIGA